LNFLRKYYSDLIAILLSSFVFAIFHLNVLQGITAFALGIFLAITAIKTRSIFLCIYAHFLNNLLFMFSSNYFIIQGFNDNSANFQPLWFDVLGIMFIILSVVVSNRR
jgi:membrane protease YdiL (CAAX protease family)